MSSKERPKLEATARVRDGWLSLGRGAALLAIGHPQAKRVWRRYLEGRRPRAGAPAAIGNPSHRTMDPARVGGAVLKLYREPGGRRIGLCRDPPRAPTRGPIRLTRGPGGLPTLPARRLRDRRRSR